jgi:hypothetical protein
VGDTNARVQLRHRLNPEQGAFFQDRSILNHTHVAESQFCDQGGTQEQTQSEEKAMIFRSQFMRRQELQDPGSIVVLLCLGRTNCLFGLAATKFDAGLFAACLLNMVGMLDLEKGCAGVASDFVWGWLAESEEPKLTFGLKSASLGS